jgi:hypothetical protein
VTITYEGHEYIIDVEPNEYFPTNESMYKVYLGFQNISEIHGASKHPTGVEVDVEELIKVTFIHFYEIKMNEIQFFINQKK